jgi:hypothetical protein
MAAGGLAITSVTLGVLNRHYHLPAQIGPSSYLVPWGEAIAALVWAACGWYLTIRRPGVIFGPARVFAVTPVRLTAPYGCAQPPTSEQALGPRLTKRTLAAIHEDMGRISTQRSGPRGAAMGGVGR